MIGRTLGHYRIDSKLGEGGMGVVYKARDTHLNRFVALKLLPSEKMSNPESKRRFVQEAKAASALSHPNIVHIYDINEANGVEFIAMEYVEGKTLDEVIGRKPLRTGEVLNYAVQIADALAAAHAAGIVHRDVKPRNVMVSDKGLVKVLDFGLAKLKAPEEADVATLTQTMRASTEEGIVIGTAPYMSPEQAEGKKVDRRSDIFSFGSVLYEMIAGQPAFQGDTRIATLSAILHQEPKRLSQFLGSGSSEIERVISVCHRKDPSRRFQHMEDVKALLQSLKDESDSDTGQRASDVPTHPARARWRYALALAAGGILIVTLSGVAWRLARPRPPLRGPMLTRLTSDPGLTTDPALSPDGKLLAFASDRSGEENLDIWVRQVTGGQAIRLTSDAADDHEPVFSPDGSKIAFRSERQQGAGVYVMSALGGEARLIAAEGRTPRFSPDGTQIAYWVGMIGAWGNSIYAVLSAGGSPRRIHPEFGTASYPTWSPDGKRLLFMGKPDRSLYDLGDIDWYASPLDGGTAVKTDVRLELDSAGFAGPLFGGWISPDVCSAERNSCLFSGTVAGVRNLWEIPISAKSWKVAAPPRRLTSGTTLELQPSVPLTSTRHPGTHRGTMQVAFASLNENVDIWSLPLDSNRRTVTASPERLTTDLADDMFVNGSRDGTKVVFVSARSGNPEVWYKDLRTGKETQVTASAARKTAPALSASALKLAYSANEPDGLAMYAVSLGPSVQPGIAKKVCSQCGGNPRWSPDEKSIINVQSDGSVRLVDAASGQKTTVIEHQQDYAFWEPTPSPDNAWLAFVAQALARARSRIYVAAFRPGEPCKPNQWIAVTDEGYWGDTPRWSPDGRTIYFIDERDGFRCIWAQPLDSATKQPVGSPIAIYHSHSARRSLLNVSITMLSIDVAVDKIVFSMGERTGNIWMADLEAPR